MSASERKFLHDIATPLATAIFILETLKEDLVIAHGKDSPVVEMLGELEKAMAKSRDLLTERRHEILQAEKESK